MANHVMTNITIEGNKKLMKFLEEKRKLTEERNKEDNYLALIGAFYDDMENNISWFGENVGAKWCYHDDFWVDGEEAEISTTSAWYYPEHFVKHLFEVCSKIDPECNINGDYEDESYSPVGAFAINKNGFHQQDEDDFEYPDEENYINEEGETDYDVYDNAMEEFYELIYETRSTLRSKCINELSSTTTEVI